MPAEIVLPVYVRVCDSDEIHIGDVALPVTDDEVKVPGFRAEMAAFYRALADVLEKPDEDDEEPQP
jgi:hypothetical protein